MKLPKSHVATIAAQDLRLGDSVRVTHFVRVAEHKFAGFQRLLMRVAARNAAAFDRGMTDAITETKRLSLPWPNVTILPPKCRDAAQLEVGLSRALHRMLELRGVRRERGDHCMHFG